MISDAVFGGVEVDNFGGGVKSTCSTVERLLISCGIVSASGIGRFLVFFLTGSESVMDASGFTVLIGLVFGVVGLCEVVFFSVSIGAKLKVKGAGDAAFGRDGVNGSSTVCGLAV